MDLREPLTASEPQTAVAPLTDCELSEGRPEPYVHFVADVGNVHGEQGLLRDLLRLFDGRIRKTKDVPPKVSVLDLIKAVTGNVNPSKTWGDITAKKQGAGAEIAADYKVYHFPGAGQKDTPVTTATGVIRILNFLPGRRAGLLRQLIIDRELATVTVDSAGK